MSIPQQSKFPCSKCKRNMVITHETPTRRRYWCKHCEHGNAYDVMHGMQLPLTHVFYYKFKQGIDHGGGHYLRKLYEHAIRSWK